MAPTRTEPVSTSQPARSAISAAPPPTRSLTPSTHLSRRPLGLGLPAAPLLEVVEAGVRFVVIEFRVTIQPPMRFSERAVRQL